jgi:hypothetical protein
MTRAPAWPAGCAMPWSNGLPSWCFTTSSPSRRGVCSPHPPARACPRELEGRGRVTVRLPNTWPRHTADSDRGSVNLRTPEAAFRRHVDAGGPAWSVA